MVNKITLIAFEPHFHSCFLLQRSDILDYKLKAAPEDKANKGPAVYILEQSCKQPQASTQKPVPWWDVNRGRGPSVVGVSTEKAERHKVASSQTSFTCQRILETEVWQTQEVSVSYYSLVNTSTFPFWDSAVRSWVTRCSHICCWCWGQTLIHHHHSGVRARSDHRMGYFIKLCSNAKKYSHR